MKFAMGCWGSRGDVEPCVAVASELVRRGHQVTMAVPPDQIRFTEAAGVTAVAVGPETAAILDAHRDFWTCFFGTPWKVKKLAEARGRIAGPIIDCWQEMDTKLRSLAAGTDLILTGVNFEDAAANVAEHFEIPLATVHYFPQRPNASVAPGLPAPVSRAAVRFFWWMSWLATKKIEEKQRLKLGLPRAKGSAAQRISARGALEIQAYDAACFPGLADEWAACAEQRPFVGTLTLQLATSTDAEVMSWISEGTPPIFFGFGSMPVESPAETIAMIAGACHQLGQRALIGAGWTDFSAAESFPHLKMVGAVNYASVFPLCRALVHHGGSSTTPIGLRAGVPQLILYWDLVHAIYAVAVKRLKVGTARRYSAVTQASLVADLSAILAPAYADRARQLAPRIADQRESARHAADLLERAVRQRLMT